MELDFVLAFKAFTPEPAKVVTWVRSNEGLPFPVKTLQHVMDVEITWVRKVRGHVILTLGDRPLRKVISCADRAAFLDLLNNQHVRHSARTTAAEWGLSTGNEVDVSIRVWMEDFPTFGAVPNSRALSTPRYYSLSNLQQPVIPWYEGIDLARARDEELPMGPERHSLTKIWSSRWTDSECEAARARFRLRADEEVRTIGVLANMDDMIDI
ncbi:hypothetical protein HFO56_02670 [Rhizobium laguerreae]|uniref:hypothetical protein n=1 Tax=Rhizobium laguerreae TaxID=1076926 RepID=UPI001C91B6F8|nr:hypothetical protein [Rhizobium laguerreae]MBY3151289.1 hypothetical protein [Rhizobium laguerreae]